MFCLNKVLKCLTCSVSVVVEFSECVFNYKTVQLIWEISFVIFIQMHVTSSVLFRLSKIPIVIFYSAVKWVHTLTAINLIA